MIITRTVTKKQALPPFKTKSDEKIFDVPFRLTGDYDVFYDDEHMHKDPLAKRDRIENSL